MTPTDTSATGIWPVVILCVTAFLVLLPAILTTTRSRTLLGLAALLLSLISGGIFIGSSFLGGIAALGTMPLALGCWLGGLLCGLASFLDAAADRRARELAFRLLHNEAQGLGSASTYGIYQPKPARRATDQSLTDMEQFRS